MAVSSPTFGATPTAALKEASREPSAFRRINDDEPSGPAGNEASLDR